MTGRRIAVTGADGQIGRRVVARLAPGMTLRLSRRQPRDGGPDWAPFDLADPNPQVPVDVRAIIHLAADLHFALTPAQELANLRGLLDGAAKIGARVVFVSSQSAKNPLGEYGARKAAGETLVKAAGGVIVRPGLVLGGRRPKGIAAQLIAAARLPLFPDLGPRARVQPIHIDDLAAALVALADAPSDGTVELGGSPITLRGLITLFGATLRGAAPLFLPIPTFALHLVSHGAQRGAQASLRQMLHLAPIADELGELGIAPTDLRLCAIASNAPLRRGLLMEGAELLREVGAQTPRGQMLRRYARIIERDAPALLINLAPLRRLGAAAIMARADRTDLMELRRRLSLALALFECSPDGAAATMRFVRTSWLGAALRLAMLGPGALLDTMRVLLAPRRSKAP